MKYDQADRSESQTPGAYLTATAGGIGVSAAGKAPLEDPVLRWLELAPGEHHSHQFLKVSLASQSCTYRLHHARDHVTGRGDKRLGCAGEVVQMVPQQHKQGGAQRAVVVAADASQMRRTILFQLFVSLAHLLGILRLTFKRGRAGRGGGSKEVWGVQGGVGKKA